MSDWFSFEISVHKNTCILVYAQHFSLFSLRTLTLSPLLQQMRYQCIIDLNKFSVCKNGILMIIKIVFSIAKQCFIIAIHATCIVIISPLCMHLYNKIQNEIQYFYNKESRLQHTWQGPTSQAKKIVVKAAKYSLANLDGGSIVFIC